MTHAKQLFYFYIQVLNKLRDLFFINKTISCHWILSDINWFYKNNIQAKVIVYISNLIFTFSSSSDYSRISSLIGFLVDIQLR